ncbi:MAG: FkbM family methyltransferase [Oscillospiraceae bacterium]|nr:FkbM family methyltransferase [Oscillospiraceae bacterium]
MNLIKRTGNFLRSRLSGEFAEKIKKLKEILEIIDNLPPLDDNFWINWYRDCLKVYYKYFKLMRFLPSKFARKFHYNFDASYKSISQNDRIVLKDISLPMPVKSQREPFIRGEIIDSILHYLLSDMETQLFYRLIFVDKMEGPYEYKSVILEENDIVIDAGANAGAFSALAGVKGCKAYAFEPMPDIIETYLKKTAEWNPNIKICEYALSDKRENLIFNVGRSLLASSSVKNSRTTDMQVTVQAIDLDSFVEENNLPRVDFIKADIEGAERYMLMGAKRVLKEFAPKIAICKYHLPDDPKVLRELILDANPNYIIEERWKKMYAYVPKV